ncbi:undecaprenyl-diphosphatase 1 [Virgibacillus pantothenticus]|uniref:Undecaprenyl-diphosphatase n=1 Tax=Virgibacillus pantothenticus TaxID=1473 RepID=A0A0L0QV06_VIRPA|nr:MULTISPECIES: undecaprenyl-diphosphate phosphatase [Virgibacillus]API91029.1 UDP pyrophosphate phosphatase [Virgibacillus sp. 6R]KNE22013.1 UDP pyrophosphate phosphatase [Virgibacillus pantothenticus]MBS7429016.1 undecaprenyl-diphosphate phosphatase [Virgibacillus sp. 19R1-5]MBU8566769.1 undecaprenyl-diphosphate phosphatase [Virgibacillus pantothenticus]MBU8600352.1 undecaprenyl-diphosphate phosphatase [Virgibacillus pantothenticus]
MDAIADLSIILKYLLLGLFQGFTEPIPISSSGHLVMLRDILNLQVELAGLSFEILVNFGSLIAVLVIFRKDLIRLTRNGLRYIFQRDRDSEATADFQFILFLIIATIPTGVLGFLLEDYISEQLSKPIIVGYTLLITGAALWVIRNLHGKKNDGDLTIKDALIVGAAQAVSLIPGISRSGATIVAAMLVGMKRETAFRFSFLLYIPVSLGVTILGVSDIVNDDKFSALLIPYAIAFLASIIASYFALKWFANIMAKGNLKYFSFYCFIVGILAIIYFL